MRLPSVTFRQPPPLEAAVTPIETCDLQIAARALANNLIPVTHNTREFGRVVGLQFEDWEA
jgi:tRNA(fMet)-specific endonuclease VapC